MADLGADLKRFCRERFGPLGVPGDLCPRGAHEGENPVQRRLTETLDRVPHDLEASVRLVDVPDEAGSAEATIGGEKEEHWVTEPFGANEGVCGPGQRMRQVDRAENTVEHPHDRGLVTGVPSDGHCFGGQRIATVERSKVEFLAQGGEHQHPVGIICRNPIKRKIEDLDLLGIGGSRGAVPASVVGQRCSHQPVGITEV